LQLSYRVLKLKRDGPNGVQFASILVSAQILCLLHETEGLSAQFHHRVEVSNRIDCTNSPKVPRHFV
jgi:hypothetical protein